MIAADGLMAVCQPGPQDGVAIPKNLAVSGLMTPSVGKGNIPGLWYLEPPFALSGWQLEGHLPRGSYILPSSSASRHLT